MRLLVPAFLLLPMLLVAGCGPGGPPAYVVHGKVTFRGEPVADGVISFLTEDMGPDAVHIKNGEYRLNVKRGKHLVTITAAKKVPLPPGQKGLHGESDAYEDFIPEQFNTKTTLSADITESRELDFDLQPN